MQQLLALIEKFKADKANSHEKQQLLNALAISETELKTWLEADYQQAITNRTNLISKEKSAQIFKEIHQRKTEILTAPATPKAKVIHFKKAWLQLASAACIIGFMALGFWYANKETAPTKTLAAVNNAQQLKQIANTTSQAISINLQDGSTVVIEPKSAISYYLPFANKRDISLSGKAFFKVAKDKTKPFTVYAGGIATTALGTQFTVNALVKNKVEVKLFEGKVVVKSVDKNVYAINDVYLLPGQMAVAAKLAQSFAVTSFSANDAIAKNKQFNSPITHQDADNLVFDNEPLEKVIGKLNKQYNTQINYTQSQIAGLYFSGSVLKTDSLKTILNIIANMNGLVYEEVGGNIFIKKQP